MTGVRAARALALAMAALVALSAIAAAASAGAQGAQGYVAVASSDARLAAAYGASAQEVEQLAALAEQLYRAGNYTGAEEVSLKAMELAASLLASLPASSAPQAGELESLISALRGLAAAEYGNSSAGAELESLLSAAYGYASSGDVQAAREIVAVVESYLANASSRLSAYGLEAAEAELAAYERAAEGALSESLGAQLAEANLTGLLDALVAPVESLLAEAASYYEANATPPSLVALAAGLELLEAEAPNVSLGPDMALRASALSALENYSSELAAYSSLLARYAAELEAEGGEAAEALGNATSLASDLAEALRLYISLNLSGAGEALRAASGYVAALGALSPQAGLAASWLYGNLSLLVNDSANLSEALGAVRSAAYANESLSAAEGAAADVSEALYAASQAEAPAGYSALAAAGASLNASERLLAEALSSYPQLNASALGALDASLGRLAALLNGSLANLTYAVAVARPQSPGAQLESMLYVDWAMGNASEALSYYAGGEAGEADQEAIEAMYAAQAAESYLYQNSYLISAPMYDMLYALAQDAYVLGYFVNAAAVRYPTPPAKYLGELREAAEGVAYLSGSLNLSAEAYSLLAAGEYAAANATLSEAEALFWDSVPYVENFTDFLSQYLPYYALEARRGAADVAAIAYSLSESLWLSLALGNASEGALVAAAAYASYAALEAQGIANASEALSAWPDAPAGFNETMLSAASGAEVILGITNYSERLLAEAGAQVSEALANASTTERALSYLSESAGDLEASMEYLAEANWTASAAEASEALAAARLLSGASGWEPTEYVASLAAPLEGAAAAAGLLAGGAGQLYAEGGAAAKAYGYAEGASALLGSASQLVAAAALSLYANGTAPELQAVLSANSSLGAYCSALSQLSAEAPAASNASEACLEALRLLSGAASEISGAQSALALPRPAAIVALVLDVNSSASLYLASSGGSLVLAVGPRGLAPGAPVELVAREGAAYLASP